MVWRGDAEGRLHAESIIAYSAGLMWHSQLAVQGKGKTEVCAMSIWDERDVIRERTRAYRQYGLLRYCDHFEIQVHSWRGEAPHRIGVRAVRSRHG